MFSYFVSLFSEYICLFSPNKDGLCFIKLVGIADFSLQLLSLQDFNLKASKD